SPYDASIDINAVYNLKTSLYELLSSTHSVDRSTKVPVECILNLSDNFRNPLVKFDINFPTLESQTKSYIQGLFSSQDEINKQMFSLLILNKFYTPDYMNTIDLEERGSSYQAGMNTASELLSNQLSRWLSQISQNFDVGFSYRPGDNITADEVELALSTQLLNDRITLSANGNMDVGGNRNTTAGSTNSNIAGDFDLEAKLNRQGTLKVKAYSHTDEKIIYNSTETIQGVGISYQETFDTFKELAQKYFAVFWRKKQKTNAK
ncbi:MAG: translocation/assembly module TamB, partial [Culturomica sp.]|nr:translocation/assembly module TamB [Culturomica sp.]